MSEDPGLIEIAAQAMAEAFEEAGEGVISAVAGSAVALVNVAVLTGAAAAGTGLGAAGAVVSRVTSGRDGGGEDSSEPTRESRQPADGRLNAGFRRSLDTRSERGDRSATRSGRSA